MDLFDQLDQERIDELGANISQARHDYYNNQPSVPDELYDAWVDELAELKENHPVVAAVGAPPVSDWPKVNHTVPMGSLSKVQTMDEMTSWIQKVSREKGTASYEKLLVAEKLDGISVSLRYEKGRFVQGLTRGDGETGEDITPNVARMKNVPARLHEPVSATFRGEILLYKDDFVKYFPGMQNPRNAASGTAKRLDGSGSEHLTVLVYQVLEGPDLETEEKQFEFIKKVGLKNPQYYITAMAPGMRTPHDIWVDYQQSVREALPYEIDGLVVRVNDMPHQLSLGEKNNRPIGAVAFKFSMITRETVSVARIDQVGGTGIITPVAEFRPIRLLGAEVSRASLYNQKYVEQIGFDVGCRILVGRSNDVIPRVASVVRRTGAVSQPPTHCPECGTPTERSGEFIVCPNTGECPAQVEGRIRQWIKELGILEWGPTLVSRAVSTGLVKSVPDLYRLHQRQVQDLERMGAASAKKAVEQLWVVTPLPLEQLMGALAVPLCATSTMQLLVDAGYDTVHKLKSVRILDLENIPGFGPKRAQSFRRWLDSNEAVLDDLVELVGVKERPVGALTGKTVCFTGASSVKRSDLIRLAEEAGGTVKKSVVKGLTYLVMADPSSNSSKAKAARKNKTECISEEGFLEIVGTNG
jgi:DNA ligase (NAD+)